MKRRLLVVAKLSISALLLGYLFSLIDFKLFFSRFSGINAAILAVAFVLLLSQTALSALKWKLILQVDGAALPYPFLLRTYLIGGFLSLFLPTSFGGDIYRVIAVKDASQSLGKSVSSVLFDRLTGLFALVSISILSYLFLPGSRYGISVFALYALSIVLFAGALSDAFLKWMRGIRPALFRKLGHLLQSFVAYRNNLRHLTIVVGLAFVFQLNIVIISKMYCLALGIDIAFVYLLVVIPLIYLTEMLPISINGLGVRESAFVFFFVQLGYTKEEGLAVALLVVFSRYLAGLVGGLLLLLTVLKTRSKRPETET